MIKFRKTEPRDVPVLTEWIEADPGHRGMEPGFFTCEGPFVACYLVEDRCGPVIFVRAEKEGPTLRLHTQFAPDPKRVAAALKEAYPLVAEDARQRGFRSVRFESKSIALIRFMFKHFGFRADLIADL